MSKWSMTSLSIRIVIGLAALVAAALLLMGVMAWQTERRLAANLAAIRAEGDPASIAELAPTPIADEENAAVILERLGPRLDAFSKDYGRFLDSAMGKAYEERIARGEAATADQFAAIRAILDQYPEIPTGIADAAKREKYASTADFSLDQSTFLDQWLKRGRVRPAARYLNWQNEVLLSDGKHDEAVEQGTELMRIARLHDGEPLLVNYLMGVAVRGIAANMLYDALAAGPVRPELHVALDKELALHDTSQRIVRALKSDRAYSASVTAEAGVDPANTKVHPILVSFLGWPVKRQFISALDYSDEQIALVEKSWPNVNKRVGRGDAPRENELGTLAQLMVPALQAAYDAEARTVAMMRALRVFNALRQFAAENGREATGLDELDLPKNATIDPYRGEPLRLKKSDDGWVVYSVFRNGVDDGGDFTEMKDFGVAPRKLRGTE